MVSNTNLKTLFWNHVMESEENPDAAFDPYETLDLVEEFTALAADGVIPGIDEEQDFPNEDLVEFENRVYHAIGLHVVYVPSEDSGSSRTATWARA